MRILAIGLLAALLAGPAGAKAPPPAKPLAPPLRTAEMPAHAAAAKPDAPVNATPALWVVHGPKGIAYLLGSIHALPKNVDWEKPYIKEAARRADTFVFEVKMDSDSLAHDREVLTKEAFLPISESLPSYFDEDMRNQYREVIFLTHADPSAIVYMRPWRASMALEGAADGRNDLIPSEGVDNKIYAEAVARHVKDFRPLEPAEDQFKLFIGDGDMQHEMTALKLTFMKILAHKGEKHPDLVDAWEKGDTKTLAEVSKDQPKDFLEDRNRRWVPEIEAMLKEKHTYFITVGALHLVGPTGVPNLLRAQGYKVDGP
ncbi:MAG TPA: TraB/GumN family protein [Rhizomicrobium sp.]|nr:TraB/GumN family protein [Rhizomicrobium sp.]